jgi:chloramphenicol O-acetyltransferase type B
MVTGTPRQRFGSDGIARPQALTWWDWPDEQVQALLPQIQQREVALLDVGKQPSRRNNTRTGDLAPLLWLLAWRLLSCYCATD